MKDIFGTEFKPGDIIMYPVRYSSSMWMTCAVVKEVGTRKEYNVEREYCYIEKNSSTFLCYYSEEEIPEDQKHLGFERTDSHKHSDFINGKYISYSPPEPYSFWSAYRYYWKRCGFQSSSRATILSDEQIEHFISTKKSSEKKSWKGSFGDMEKYKKRRQKWQKQ